MTTILNGMTWEHERGFNSMVAAADAYARLVPEVEVRWTFRSLQAFADQHLERLVEEFDLLVIDHPHIPLAATRELFAPLDGVGFDAELATLAQQSVGRSHESYRFGERQWALATDAAAQVAAYRPDLIDEPPRDWDAVLALAREGRVVWPYKPVDAWSSLITIASGLGEEPMRTPGRFLSEKVLVDSLGVLRTLAELVPKDNQFWNPIEAAEALSTGDQFVYCPLLFGYTNYSRLGYRPHRLKYVDIPASVRGVAGSLLGGAGTAVSARSAHREEAIRHAFWLASADVQAGPYYAGGGQPGNAVAWESPALNEDSLDFFRGTRRTLEGAYLRPRSPEYIEIQNELSPLVTEAICGRVSDADLLSQLDAGVVRMVGP